MARMNAVYFLLSLIMFCIKEDWVKVQVVCVGREWIYEDWRWMSGNESRIYNINVALSSYGACKELLSFSYKSLSYLFMWSVPRYMELNRLRNCTHDSKTGTTEVGVPRNYLFRPRPIRYGPSASIVVVVA